MRPVVATFLFTEPRRLWAIAAVIAVGIAYLVLVLARRRTALRYADAALLPTVAPDRPPWWRHLLVGAALLALIAASAGAARPIRRHQQARRTATILLAIDTSDSMGATDVEPTRIAAATKAARSFVQGLPSGFSVGLVTAGAGAGVLVAPTTDHRAVEDALGRLQLHPGTALGDAILAALAAVDPTGKVPVDRPAVRIVLLSDGISTTGAPDDTAIAAAVDAKVPVSTISFGTDHASVVSQGQTVEVPVDQTALKHIADGTDGRFFGGVTSTAELRSIYDKIGTDVRYIREDTDLSSILAGLALVLLLTAVATSLASTSRALPV